MIKTYHVRVVAPFLFLALLTSGWIGPKPKVTQTLFCTAQVQPITPETTIFAFDFHGVIATSAGFLERAKILWKSPCRSMAIKYSPILLYTLFKLRNQLSSAEEVFSRIIELYPELAICRQTFIDIANAQEPDKDTQAIMQALHEQGFKIYLFSNIGEIVFNDLLQRRPDLLRYIDGYCVVCAARGYIAKPDARMYTQFMQEFNSDGSKQVIFVDDIRKNIEGGCTANMISILFRSPAQLRRDLDTLGISIPELHKLAVPELSSQKEPVPTAA